MSNSQLLKFQNWFSLLTAVQVHCLCTNEGLPLHFTSASKEAHLTFIVNNMTAIDDFHTLHFEAEWEFIRAPACLLPHKLQGPSGEVNLVNPPENVEEVINSFFYLSPINHLV